ncbi:MAG: hypothetical protein J6C67_07915 [Muribaculaceae bacterium]|nr:hypothetical protein [Muribaculaceae bacterium]
MINLPPYPELPPSNWQGMTLREIQMRRTLVQARMEIQKYKMNIAIEGARQKLPFFGGSGVLSRLAGAFSFAEYAFMAIRLFRLAAPLFKRKK